MAKRTKNRYTKKPSKRVVRQDRRVLNKNASSKLHVLQNISDNRLFSPIPRAFRPVVNLQMKSETVYTKPNLNRYGPMAYHYIPKEAVTCARRKIRKEVIFAKRKSGKGNKRPRFNETSNLKCR